MPPHTGSSSLAAPASIRRARADTSEPSGRQALAKADSARNRWTAGSGSRRSPPSARATTTRAWRTYPSSIIRLASADSASHRRERPGPKRYSRRTSAPLRAPSRAAKTSPFDLV